MVDTPRLPSITRSLLSLATGSPTLIPYFLVAAKHVTSAFDATVAPIVREVFHDSAAGERIHRTLLGTSVKIGLAMWGYSRLIRVPFNATAVALGSAYTRVYDDLIDNFAGSTGPGIDNRLDDLFHSRDFVPVIDLERLLLKLYRTIEMTIQPRSEGSLYAAMRELHRYQRQSHRQRETISAGEVGAITRGKGGHGLIALFALLRPDPTRAEHELLMELGDVLQLLDDHHDFPLDLSQGIGTSVTLGQSTLPQLGIRIRGLRRDFRRHYRRRPLTLWTMLHLMEVGALLVHRRYAQGSGSFAPASRPTVLRLFFGRADNINPAWSEPSRAAPDPG